MARRQEENIKIKIVLPLLEDKLGYSRNDFDFEHNVRNKRADIGILLDNKLHALIEVKDIQENLDRHIDQTINYGLMKQIDFVGLTNGKEFRIYATFAKGVVTPSARLIKSFDISQTGKSVSDLKNFFGRDVIPDFSELNKLKKKLKPKITEQELTDILKDCTVKINDLLFSQFKIKYKHDRNFKEKIDKWALQVKLDIKDAGLIQKLCKKGSYTLVNRILFYKISEDKSLKESNFTEEDWRSMVEKPSCKLSKIFKDNKNNLFEFYNSPLFNSIKFDDVDWDEQIIRNIMLSFASIDFSSINYDMIGKSYENHISSEERKKLGQFYTPSFIVDYLIDAIKIKKDDSILDPSCGSGAFLSKSIKVISKNKSIVETIEQNIYGIDINPFAIQLTTMNFLLSSLDHCRMPKVNLITADSLIDKNIKDQKLLCNNKEIRKNIRNLNNFLDSGEQLFDVVVGNPPYLCSGLRGNKKLKKEYNDYIRERWSNSAQYKISYYPLFIERGISLLKPQGKLAFIIPDSFLVGCYFSKVRKYILDNCKICEIVLCKEDFWEGASVGSPVLIILQKEKEILKRNNNNVVVKFARTGSNIISRKFIQNSYQQNIFNNLTKNRFELYFTSYSKKMTEEMRNNTEYKFEDVIKGHTGMRSKIGQDKISYKIKKNSYCKKGLRKSNQIEPYKIKYENDWLEVKKELLHGGGYDPDIVEKPKILIRQTGDSLIASIDKKKFYHVNNVFSISPLSENVPLEWICLLFNSKILNFFYQTISMEKGRANAQVNIDQIHDFPYPKISQSDEEKARKLYKILNSEESHSRKYKQASLQAEKLVFKAYRIEYIENIEKVSAAFEDIEKVIKKSAKKKSKARKRVSRKKIS